MKKILISTLILCFSFATYAQDIKLSAPEKSGGFSVMEAFNKRQSTDNFVEKDLTSQELSNLLWAANGINRENGKRTAPSAVNAQEMNRIWL